MNLIINNKLFKFSHNENGDIIIRLRNELGKSYFRTWQGTRFISDGILRYKKDYIKDIFCVYGAKIKVFKSCFPIISKDEKFVKLVYDCEIILN